MSTQNVYTGTWIDYSKGSIVGSTITLTSRDAGFLLAILVAIAGAAGRSLWTIISYIVHQVRTSRKPRDGLFHQQQAILRNSPSPLHAASSFALSSLAWGKSRAPTSSSIGNLFLILAPLSIFALATVVRIFATRVQTAAGSSFLLKGDTCGMWNFENMPNDPQANIVSTKMRADADNAANYARNCYEANGTQTSQCGSYQVPSIPYTVNKNATCPFSSGSCMWSDTAAYSMDTGYLDSHDILGVNAPASERMLFRQVTTCAPVNLIPYLDIINETMSVNPPIKDTVFVLSVGAQVGVTNFTWTYNTHSSLITDNYDLVTIQSNWAPIAAFNSSTATVTLFTFASNNVYYNYPNHDFLYSANLKSSPTSSYYSADSYFKGLMCADSYQICNPNTAQSAICSPLMSMKDLTDFGPLTLGITKKKQYLTADLFRLSVLPITMYGAVYGRGASALLAQRTVVSQDAGGSSQVAKIPNNQWQLEVESWFQCSLAKLQQRFVEFAAGPTNLPASSIGSPDIYAPLCKQLLVRNASGYQNFSVLGMSLLLAIGLLIMIIGFYIDSIAGFIQRRFGKDFARLSWASDGYLQLQRMAYEGAGYEGWKECTGPQPVYGEDDQGHVFAPLNIDDKQHPRLVKNSTGSPSSADNSNSDYGKSEYVPTVQVQPVPAQTGYVQPSYTNPGQVQQGYIQAGYA